MTDMKRTSPVQFNSRPIETETRDHWTVALEYEEEGPGPWLVDLSHKSRWDLQDGSIDARRPIGLAIPGKPGRCRLENGVLINRMNRTQAAIWLLAPGDVEAMPEEYGYTDVSEASVFLALFGPHVFSILEKLSALDFLDPEKQTPFLLQGPFSHVPCQLATLERESDGSGGLLLTGSRGYAKSMVHAILAAGAAHGLCPAGEYRFTSWLESIQAPGE